jgi:hypothetical protein
VYADLEVGRRPQRGVQPREELQVGHLAGHGNSQD